MTFRGVILYRIQSFLSPRIDLNFRHLLSCDTTVDHISVDYISVYIRFDLERYLLTIVIKDEIKTARIHRQLQMLGQTARFFSPPTKVTWMNDQDLTDKALNELERQLLTGIRCHSLVSQAAPK